MNYKYTQDGKKVVVIGQINSKETIVQEVFVKDGTEFPAGDHFVVKTILDSPAETYKSREERKLMDRVKSLEGERDKVLKEIDSFRFSAKAAASKINWINGIADGELQSVVDNIKSMLSGEYTHVVLLNPIRVAEWDHRLFSRCGEYSRDRFEAIRLVSLFGEWNGRLSMDWRVNTYQDGSGSSSKFIPCKSRNEAVEKAFELINEKESLSDTDVEFCKKYNLHVDETKNAVRISKKTESLLRMIANAKKQIEDLESQLAAVS